MPDHLTIAKAFLEEQLANRSDIVAAYVYGSVARGDATEFSDIDMAFVIDGEPDPNKRGGGIDVWRNGTYIEASLHPKTAYDDPADVLAAPFKALPFYHGLILHDPTGFLTAVHQQVRAEFMKPQWLNVRVNHWLETSRNAFQKLSAALESGDDLGICASFLWALGAPLLIPLLMADKNPSMARVITQLGEIQPESSERICEVQGADGLKSDDLRTLLKLVEAASVLKSDSIGHAGEYMLKRIEATINDGRCGEALNSMWIVVGSQMAAVEGTEDASVRTASSELATRWLRGTGWESPDVRAQRLQTVGSLLAGAEDLAGDHD